MRRYLPFWITALVLLGFFVFTEEKMSKSFADCVSEWSKYERQAEPNKDRFVIAQIAGGHTLCIVEAIDKHNGLFAAVAAFIIAWFTYTLYGATVSLRDSTDKLWTSSERQIDLIKENSAQQFKDTQETIKLARDEFVSTHRPRIVLREAIIGVPVEGQPISVIFQLANVGDTAGSIIRSYARVGIVPRGPIPLLHVTVEQHSDLGEIVLGPGQAVLLTFKGDTPKWESNRFQEKSYMTTSGSVPYRDATIHFYGQLIYRDHGPGIWRRTAFRRQLIPERQRFYRIPDEPDLDYSD